MLKKKRWLLAGIIALAAIALLVLVLLLVKNGRSKQINVYAVSDFSMDQYWGSESETYGAVYLDKIQTVYISDTQKISEVYVKEGQTVKAGEHDIFRDPVAHFGKGIVGFKAHDVAEGHNCVILRQLVPDGI